MFRCARVGGELLCWWDTAHFRLAITSSGDLGEHVGGVRHRESGRLHSEIGEEGAEAAEIPQLVPLSEPQFLRGAVSPAAAQS